MYLLIQLRHMWVAKIADIVLGIGLLRPSSCLTKQCLTCYSTLIDPLFFSRFSSGLSGCSSSTTILWIIAQQYIIVCINLLFHRRLGSAIMWNLAWKTPKALAIFFLLLSCLPVQYDLLSSEGFKIEFKKQGYFGYIPPESQNGLFRRSPHIEYSHAIG